MKTAAISRNSWFRSSRCESSHCVEIMASRTGRVHMRDAKDPHGPRLNFDLNSWADFIHGVRHEGRQS